MRAWVLFASLLASSCASSTHGRATVESSTGAATNAPPIPAARSASAPEPTAHSAIAPAQPTARSGERMHSRDTTMLRCSGIAPEPNEPDEWPTIACDRCLRASDCTARPGGECVWVGGERCNGPEHLECRYPRPECDPTRSRDCGEPPIPYPPGRAE